MILLNVTFHDMVVERYKFRYVCSRTSLLAKCLFVVVLDCRLVNLCLRVWLGRCVRKTRVYTGLGRISLRLVQTARVLALVCTRGYK
jgi:hypothetical protein